MEIHLPLKYRALGHACSVETKPAQQSVTVKDAVALAKLTTESNERFELAIKSFEEAGKEARRAFHNAATNSFDTGLKNDYYLMFVSVSCNNEIMLLTTKVCDFFKSSGVLHLYTEDGQLQKTVKYHPSEGRNCFDNLFYTQFTKNIIGNVWNHDNSVLIEYLSGQTAELLHSYLLYNTNFPEACNAPF